MGQKLSLDVNHDFSALKSKMLRVIVLATCFFEEAATMAAWKWTKKPLIFFGELPHKLEGTVLVSIGKWFQFIIQLIS